MQFGRIALENHSCVAKRAKRIRQLRTLGSKIESGWLSDDRYRKSLSDSGWNESDIMQFDRIASKNHGHVAAKAPRTGWTFYKPARGNLSPSSPSSSSTNWENNHWTTGSYSSRSDHSWIFFSIKDQFRLAGRYISPQPTGGVDRTPTRTTHWCTYSWSQRAPHWCFTHATRVAQVVCLGESKVVCHPSAMSRMLPHLPHLPQNSSSRSLLPTSLVFRPSSPSLSCLISVHSGLENEALRDPRRNGGYTKSASPTQTVICGMLKKKKSKVEKKMVRCSKVVVSLEAFGWCSGPLSFVSVLLSLPPIPPPFGCWCSSFPRAFSTVLPPSLLLFGSGVFPSPFGLVLLFFLRSSTTQRPTRRWRSGPAVPSPKKKHEQIQNCQNANIMKFNIFFAFLGLFWMCSSFAVLYCKFMFLKFRFWNAKKKVEQSRVKWKSTRITRISPLQKASKTSTVNAEGSQPHRQQRPDCEAAKRKCQWQQDKCMAETKQLYTPIHPSKQRRQNPNQQFEGSEDYDYVVDRKTGRKWYKEQQGHLPHTSSSSSSSWQNSSWQNWNSWWWHSSTSDEEQRVTIFIFW